MAKVGYGATYGIFIVLVSMILGGVFIYKSTRSVMRLRDDPPPEFLNVQSNWTPKQRDAEERLARAYWQCAIALSRGEYTFGERLPEEPPAGFSVDPESHPSLVATPSAARARYWRNLQKAWILPNTWHAVYEWHTDWLFHSSNY